MSPRLPPLPTLRAFEAASRLNSYSLAAAELNVSQGAISQQIRALEADLDARLFVRSGNRMLPTEAAQALAASVREGLQLMRSGFEDFRTAGPATLVISVLPSFARLWLGPRLGEIGRRWPEVRLEIRSERALANFNADGVDFALRAGDGDWPGLEVVHLANSTAFPVASPELVEMLACDHGGELARAPLLEPENPLWSAWVGPDRRRPSGGRSATVFDDADMVVDAALEGAGVALLRSILIGRFLKSGRLVRLSPPTSTSSAAYFAVWPRRSPKARIIRPIVDWLRLEMPASIAEAEALSHDDEALARTDA